MLALATPLKEGGRLAVDVYARLAANVLWPKYWLRPITRRLRRERLFAILEWLLAPAHDHPQTAATMQEWLREAGLRDVEAGREGPVVARARK